MFAHNVLNFQLASESPHGCVLRRFRKKSSFALIYLTFTISEMVHVNRGERLVLVNIPAV